MKIGILQTGSAPARLARQQGDYDARMRWLLGEEDFDFRSYDVQGGELPRSTGEADGWIITGSRHGVYEPHAWIAPLEEFIRALADEPRPLIGICFGHQIIAQALGGRVETSALGRIVGPQIYRREDGRPFTANAWHTDQVVLLPTGSRVIASNATCVNAALHYPGFALSIQAHPEFTADYYRALLEERGHILPERARDEAERRAKEELLDDHYLVDLIRNFMRSRGTSLSS